MISDNQNEARAFEAAVEAFAVWDQTEREPVVPCGDGTRGIRSIFYALCEAYEPLPVQLNEGFGRQAPPCLG